MRDLSQNEINAIGGGISTSSAIGGFVAGAAITAACCFGLFCHFLSGFRINF